MNRKKTYNNQELLDKKQELLDKKQGLHKRLMIEDILTKAIELKRLIHNLGNKINYINIKLSPERLEKYRKDNREKQTRYYAKKNKIKK
jgi:hypothetical protein